MLVENSMAESSRRLVVIFGVFIVNVQGELFDKSGSPPNGGCGLFEVKLPPLS
jgi:hypothetical protein